VSSPRTDRWLTAILSAAAAFALGQALQAANGTLVNESLNWLIGASVLALAAGVVVRPTPVERIGERLLLLLLASAIAVQFVQLFLAKPGFYLRLTRTVVDSDFYVGLAAAALLVGIELRGNPRPRRVFFPLLLVTFVFLGRWIIRASPAPFIDVYVFQKDGIAALMHGQNPYAIRYPNIYPDSAFYGEGLSKDGVLQFGYPYLPLSLLLALPGQIWFGDYRYAQLAAMAGAAALIAYARPGRIGPAAAALFLFTPRSFFVLEQGWTDPFVVLGVAAIAFVAIRRPALVPWIFGLTLAVKQYTLFMVPAALQLLPRPASSDAVLRFAVRAAAIGAVVTLPFVIWGPRDFWFDVVALQLLQPFRNDALTFLAAWAGPGGSLDPRLALLAFVAAAAAVAIGLWRQPRTAAGFAMTCALAYIAFFAFNKQAFANYYYFALGALCVVIGTVNPEARDTRRL
jgi:uncharacterized membrane protein